MKKFISTTLMVLLILIQNSRADHIAGADLGYICLGGNQYRINLNLYIDCAAVSTPSMQQNIYFSSPCGNLPAFPIDLINPGGTEISQLCPSEINNSICRKGGTLPGIQAFYYTGVVTIAPPCKSWTISWMGCCRNYAVSNLKNTVNSVYVESSLNSADAICNSSPVFTAKPIPYVCVNQQVKYDFRAQETDGDSLYFSFITARGTGPTDANYTSGYSANSPIPGITIDPATGLLTFIPTTIGNFVIVVLVNEYNSYGIFIGSTMREMQFIVQSCSNSVPESTGNISNSINATQTGPHSIEVCEGNKFTFNTTYTDLDFADVLTLTSDISTSLTGATIKTSGSNPLTASITWTPPSGSANTSYTFNVIIDDGSCPVPAQQFYSYTIKVTPPCPKDTSFLYIPNVFTPGGTNPKFIISGHRIEKFSIQLFNRWGETVFESDDINVSWDGNNVSDGTYYYLIKAKGTDKMEGIETEKQYTEKGFVQKISAR